MYKELEMTSLSPMDEVRLPIGDPYTAYDYEVGKKRRKSAHNGSITFHEEKTYLAPDGLLRVAEDFQAFERFHPRQVKRKLNVFNDGERVTQVNLLPKDLTMEYALKAINKWGKDYASKVLSSTETGSLYWNILYHYGTFQNFKESIQA